MNCSKQAGMGIKVIVVLLVGLALVTLDLAYAQQAKVSKIGWLGIGSASSVSRYEESGASSVNSATLRART
jgi:hypothetical protein